MSDTQVRVVFLVLIMAVVAVAASGLAIGILYQTGFDQKRFDLIETARSQARLIEAVALFDKTYRPGFSGGWGAATLSQIVDAHANYEVIGGTSEFTLARREGDMIVFLLRHRQKDLKGIEPVQFESNLAEPMRRALSGSSGTMVGLDYQGTTVLAAFEPVAILNLGIVAKVDLSEIRAPFIKAGGVVAGVTLLIVAAGTILFLRISNPMIRRIQESETRYRGLFDNMGTCVAVYDTVEDGQNFIFIGFNRAAEEAEGITCGEVLGRRITEVFPGVKDFGLFAVLQRVWQTGNPENFPMAFYKDSRISGWRENYLYKLPSGEIVAVYEDATQRKRAEEDLHDSEERFRNLVEGSIQGIYIHRVFKPVFVNQACADLFGYESPEEMLSLDSVLAMIAPNERARAEQYGRSRIRGDTTPRRYEVEGVRKDGSSLWLEQNAQAITWLGEPAIQSTVVEISARKRAESALRLAKDEAEYANRAKTEFLANMSHELRTPLTIINGASDILTTEMLGPIDNPKYLDYAVNIREAGEHLLAVINDLLNVSQIEMGRFELNEENLDVGDVLSACHTLVKGRAFEAGLEFGLEIEKRLPILRGDELRIKQILLNLLSNAIKFTPKRGTVTMKAETEEDGRIVFSVTDTGVGIAPENIDKAMTDLGQAGDPYTREVQGAGLGLPLSMKLAELHGGTLELKSEPGAGTTVTVRFPRERSVK